MPLRSVPEAIEKLTLVDRPADAVAGLVDRAVPSGLFKDLVSGTWLGHALHPMLTDLPIGFWTSAWVLDMIGGKSSAKAARTLVGLGILSAVPTAVSGAADWSDTLGKERRVGFVHAAANSVALVSYGISYVERRRGRRARGVLWGWIGAGAATVGGYLGGHLVAALGIGVDNTVFDDGPEEWTPAGEADAAASEGPSLVDAGGTAIVVVGTGDRSWALADRCTHRGGPLHEGRVEGDCIVCPWHASTFRLDDGEVVRGPAALPQPAYDVRVADSTVEVRRRSRTRKFSS